MAGPAEVLARREREREQLIALARDYIERLSAQLPVLAAAIVGSVARGDFNVWSDVDVVVIAEDLPERTPDRASLLGADAPARLQPIGFRRNEFEAALKKGNRLAREAIEAGVVLVGDEVLTQFQRTRSTG